MTVSGLMRAAVAVQLLVSNPLSGMTKDLRLTSRRKGEGKIKAFDQTQLVRFLSVARQYAADVFPAFAAMAFAGIRVGEAMALKWDNVDFAAKRLHIKDQISGTTKDDEERSVERADALSAILRDLQSVQREEAFSQGKPLPRFALFPTFDESADRKAEQRVVKLIRRRMQRVLKVAELASHHTPHSLRHSFASILISKGKPIAYVQQALGHASISMTVDTYGSWLPVEAPGAVNVLAEGLAPAVPVTKEGFTGNNAQTGIAKA